MAARLDGGTPDFRGGRSKASTVDPIGQDNDEHFLRFSTPSALPGIPDCGFLDDLSISPVKLLRMRMALRMKSEW